MDSGDHLATHRRCSERICANWSSFQARRLERLRERDRFGHAAEKATESIVEDLCTMVLDWEVGDINHQVRYADILLTRLGIKYLIVEAKRPGAIAWNAAARERALEQACRYAVEQRVRSVAVSDGALLYAADVVNGGLRPRLMCDLQHIEPQESLWWLSVHGIYRPRPDFAVDLDPATTRQDFTSGAGGVDGEASLLHPKYRLPWTCFAYAGDPSDPHTWHLPYRGADGGIDLRRLPKAIQSILTNYRGARVTSVPEAAIPDVLVRLALAARAVGKMPDQTGECADIYMQLGEALEQLGRVEETLG